MPSAGDTDRVERTSAAHLASGSVAPSPATHPRSRDPAGSRRSGRRSDVDPSSREPEPVPRTSARTSSRVDRDPGRSRPHTVPRRWRPVTEPDPRPPPPSATIATSLGSSPARRRRCGGRAPRSWARPSRRDRDGCSAGSCSRPVTSARHVTGVNPTSASPVPGGDGQRARSAITADHHLGLRLDRPCSPRRAAGSST